MTLNTSAVAIRNALATRTNTPGYCQLVTRGWLGAPSAGDQDGDGDADAVDGWLSEPKAGRHFGDRRPLLGAPVAWSGGSSGNGHRALVVGYIDGIPQIRSTDAGGRGICATVPLHWVEDNWGLHYLGWSETMDGQPIPGLLPVVDPKPTPKPSPQAEQTRVQGVRADLRIMLAHSRKVGNKKRAQRIEAALADLDSVR